MTRDKIYTEPIQVWLEQEDYKRLKKLAIDSDSDVSKMVRSMIKQKLAKRPKYD